MVATRPPIVDSQVHLWNDNTPDRRPGAWDDHRVGPLGAEALLAEMDQAGVDRAVLIPPSWYAGGNEVALRAAQAHPDRFAVMGRLALERPESHALIRDWGRQPGMLGLRLTFIEKRAAWLKDGAADWIWPELERAGLPVMVLCPGLMPEIGAIAERYPGLRLILDHMAAVSRGRKDEAAFVDLPDLIQLARWPNIGVKLSGLQFYSTEAYPYPRLHPLIRRVYDAFGPRRLFWGTDLSKLPCSYHQAATMFTEEMPFLSADDLDWIMGRALCDWLGWPE